MEATLSDASDFDFLIGQWTVRHWRLKRRLAGDESAIEFDGPCTARKILHGLGNIDEYDIDLPEGRTTASTLRLFNPATGLWSLHWVDSRRMVLDPPMLGKFARGVGLFFGDDSFDGLPVKVRFIWSGITPASCRWEQAFSADGGENWETNWTMTFTRSAATA
jgi:hypothetical protein